MGAGHAGVQSAVALGQNGFTGTITVIGFEPNYAYERPPPSKEYFARKKTSDCLYIRTPTFWTEKEIHFELSVEITMLDPQAHEVTLSIGRKLGYGKLIWAAGGDPRRLSRSSAELAGVHAVRTRQDCAARRKT